ncbi:family 4 glycosyl hydrolase [Microcella humidisoli]|uniref:Glycosyl hydrolase family 4 C-terminal domain-containing protein n=1 Tax=Microcella humidisoli TaxID=2963406 RepID=A0ABY5FZD4_9MICO|nr:hypothetical protein [Microcella humidisoli]UTT63691.1 hypothetical protein NNL39_06240 [Microcella humidisoli]
MEPQNRPPIVMVVGVGSVIFGLAFLQDYFRLAAMRGSTLWLVDSNQEALDRMTRLAMSLSDVSGLGVNVRSRSQAGEVEDQVDFVVVSVAVDRDRRWQADHRRALEFGFESVLGENAGPGGLSHTLRAVPLVLDVVDEVSAHSPDAVFLNYTNPENRVCLALKRYTSVRAIGLCHGVAESRSWIADFLEMDPERVQLKVGGVNHLTWLMDINVDGVSRLDSFEFKLSHVVPDQWRFCKQVWQETGSFPLPDDRHVGEFFANAAALIGTSGYDFVAFAQKRVSVVSEIERASASAEAAIALLSQPSYEGQHGQSSPDLIAALHQGAALQRPSFILPNDGYIANLPKEAIVEVPGQVVERVASGTEVGDLPERAASICRRELEIQDLAVEAAVHGNREFAMEALMLDPVVSDTSHLSRYLDSVLADNADLLERFN